MKKSTRIKSIDLLRGLVIVIMALDHVRDYFHYDAFFFDPTDITQTNLALFGTRFITHFCAPVFIFLAGTSAFFVGQRKSKKDLSIWLLKRGFWLIFLELVIMDFGWTFTLDYSMTILQVIWVLGASMIYLAGFIHLPKKIMVAISLLAIFGHNYFDSFSPVNPTASVLWSFLHVFDPIDFSSFQIFVVYPFVPWIFVMLLGYHFGTLYQSTVNEQFRFKRLIQLGLGCVLLFFLLRFSNVYGNLTPWVNDADWSKSLISFFNISKYPPSLLYLLISMGPSFIFLAFAEKWSSHWTEKLLIFGRVPMFFYIIHIYVIHFFALIAAMIMGFKPSDMVIDIWINFQTELQGFGFNLGIVYGIWLLLIIGMYPLCKWYDLYKRDNREKWWLGYL